MNRDDSIIFRKRPLAQHLGVSISTLDRLRATDPTFPQEFRLGKRAIGFLRADVERWLASKRTS
ncbi:helix-turn-helix transcriptional regulator [Methylocaldum szegediense]|jgi:predicted DNA-binding transcriptional regulator AlpA|uniref:Prophage regulatory protein n=1 Tax=Methylocaldum szegediense TaxID=73780 RepID=A0ABN8XA23_9GAMM|nr:prophage regulatory protein [Methylocaldum szegediense]CAI8968561.1 prophage regulatory protein [Methylocaldum szegediense]